MHRTQGTRRVAAIDDHRDVALAGALRDGADVHRGVAQGAEHLGSHTVRAGHAIAHHGKDGAAERDLDALNLSFTQFGIERAAYGLLGGFRLNGRNGKADTVFRTALRDDDDGDLRVAQGTEQALRRARHADHASAFQVHQRHVFDAGNALDGQRGRGVRANLRAGFLRGEGVANPDGDFA